MSLAVTLLVISIGGEFKNEFRNACVCVCSVRLYACNLCSGMRVCHTLTSITDC